VAASRFRIDPSLLPQVALFDTGVVIRAQGDRPNEPESQTCVELWKTMLDTGREILIAAPTIAEILRFGGGQSVPRTRGIRVVSFDEPAARVLAQRFPANVIKTAAQNANVVGAHIKYDALILACGIRHQAEILVTCEREVFPRLARSVGFPAEHPSHFHAAQAMLPIPGLDAPQPAPAQSAPAPAAPTTRTT
jgi:predicted nucleic acid-binding protein